MALIGCVYWTSFSITVRPKKLHSFPSPLRKDPTTFFEYSDFLLFNLYLQRIALLPPKEFMTYSNSFILRQSLKDGFLKRIQCANNHHFTSSKALENHISKNFPEPSDFFCNIFFKACIIERETPSRQLRDVLNEWKAVIKGIT